MSRLQTGSNTVDNAKSTNLHKEIIHVGYNFSLQVDDDSLSKFIDFIHPYIEKFDENKHIEEAIQANHFYTATYFCEDQLAMRQFVDKKCRKDIFGYLKTLHIYIKEFSKRTEIIILGYITVEGQQLYPLFYNSSLEKPIAAKKLAYSEGKLVPVQADMKIMVKCAPSVTYRDSSSY